MNQLEFECEVLTPLFLGGAQTRVKPELRSPSLRGALRYWYRAILGGSALMAAGSGGDQLKALKDYEARVFGTQEKGSPVAVTVRSATQPKIGAFQKDRAIRMPDGSFQPSGKDYLLWSMAASRRPDTPRYLPNREYIEAGTKFAIALREWHDDNVTRLKKASAALWLLANLGAVGGRANRGAGSFQALLQGPADDLPDFKVCQSVDELRSYLSAGIRRCLSLVCDGPGVWRRFDGMPYYDVLSPTTAEIWVVSTPPNGWGSFVEALNSIGEKLRDYRSHRSPVGRADHDAVLDWLEGTGKTPQIKRAAFGLPIPFRYSEGGPGDVIVSEVGDRRASPLRIRITRLASGKYLGVLTLFKSRFLEEGKELRLQTRKWKAPPPTNYKVIEDFIQTFEVKRRVEL
jgi:CRISPR-associated protein Cmr1